MHRYHQKDHWNPSRQAVQVPRCHHVDLHQVTLLIIRRCHRLKIQILKCFGSLRIPSNTKVLLIKHAAKVTFNESKNLLKFENFTNFKIKWQVTNSQSTNVVSAWVWQVSLQATCCNKYPPRLKLSVKTPLQNNSLWRNPYRQTSLCCSSNLTNSGVI